MSVQWGQASNRYQGYNPFPWRIVRHRVSATYWGGRAIPITRLRGDDFRGRSHAHSRATERDTGFTAYRIAILAASCVGTAYGVSEFVVAVFK